MPKSTKQPTSQLYWIGGHFDDFQRNGRGHKARCPLHDDDKPSLSINEGADGRVLINCHAGCPTDPLLAVVGLSTRDLMPGAKRIVATYDYRDEQNALLYQVVRYEPKEFRQRRPKPGGGWDWSTKGVRRILYRLQEILRLGLGDADKRERVYIVEGEKDADRLAAIGLVATTNVGGAGKWRSEYNESFRDRHVVILTDNDPAGWDHAREVARQLHSIAASVRIVELPDQREHGDVSDWLDARGTKARLLALVRKTRHYRPSTHRANGSKNPLDYDPSGSENSHNLRETPVGKPDGLDPLGSDPLPVGSLGRAAVPPFPVEVLPGVLRHYVESIAEALPCPVDFPATMMLAVIATFIGRKRRIAIKESWKEYPTLWIASVARSGDRKTPAFEIITEPLRKKQEELYRKWQNEKAAWEIAGKEGPSPRLQQFITTDTTIEALKDVLAGNPNGICHPSDELSAWASSIGQYKGGRGDDRQIWLSIWSGVQVVCNRKSHPEPIVINDPFVCITGGIQPDALGDIIDSSREDGFSARVLFSWPDPIPHKNWSEATIKRSLDYESICCEQLWNLEPSKEPITFTVSAKARWIEWVNAHRAKQPLDNLRPTWSKAEGHCLRLTLVLHLARWFCNETRSAQIDVPSIVGGIKLIEYFKSHAHRVYGQAAMSSDNGKIAKALRWIRKHGGRVTARIAHMNGFTRDSDEAKQLFHCLEELGYGTVTTGKQGNVTFELVEKS